MAGIQTRGRGRTTANKIEQIKTQNKVVVSQSGQSTIKYKPIPASGQLDQSTQNQIQPTASNIEQSQIVKKAKTRPKLINKPKPTNTQGLTPLGKFGLGIYNTGSDYANILNTDYEDRSVLNQAIGHAFEGKWDKAGQVIQNNPYRFAGNLAVEVASNFIPFAAITKVAKVAKVATKVREGTVNKVTKVINNRLSDDVPVPEGHTRLYQVTDKNKGSMWFSKDNPKEFYAQKVEDDKGIPTIKYIDVKDEDITKYNVGQLIKDVDVEKKVGWSQPQNKPIPLRLIPEDEIMIESIPGKEGTFAADLFMKEPTKPFFKDEFIINYSDKPIGLVVRQFTRDPLGEWVLPLSYQKNVKTLAKQNQIEPKINRIFNPLLTKNKMANKLVTAAQSSNKKSVSTPQYEPFKGNAWNTSFGLANHQLKKIDVINEEDIIKREINIRFPKENKDYRPLSAGFLTPFAVSTVSKGKAAAGGYTKKFNKQNKQSFGGYGQFF